MSLINQALLVLMLKRQRQLVMKVECPKCSKFMPCVGVYKDFDKKYNEENYQCVKCFLTLKMIWTNEK